MHLVHPLPDGMRPDESNREEAQKLSDLFRIGHMRVLETKASRLETPEERLDFPSLEVGFDCIGAMNVAHDDHVLIRKTGAGQKECHSADDACFVERAHLPLGQSPEQIPHIPFACSGNEEVLPDADDKRDFLFLEPGKPYFPDELPIGQKTGDVLFSQQRDHRPHDGFSLLRVRVPLFPEEHPGDGEGGTLVDDGDREDVDVRLSPPPVCTIHRQPVRAGREQGEHEGDEELLGNLKRREEPLDAAVAGIHLGIPAEAQSDLGEVHRADGDEGKNELGEEFESLAPEREMNTQCVREGLNSPFLEVSFIGNWGKSLKSATS